MNPAGSDSPASRISIPVIKPKAFKYRKPESLFYFHFQTTLILNNVPIHIDFWHGVTYLYCLSFAQGDPKIKIISTIEEMQRHAREKQRSGETIALVPTMGFFHEGHLSLMRVGREKGDSLVVSIFVNPTQFGPGEDLDNYPKNLDRDIELAEGEGVDIVFTPDTDMLYNQGYQTYVSLDQLPNYLCGISRPVHFRGVATVVTKLFNIVQPELAVFGEKDYQQLAIIRQMVRDLNFDIEIIGSPTVREPDGLAMSSRNSYLTADQRTSALSLYQSLTRARDMVQKGGNRANDILEAAYGFISSFPGTEIDYISLSDPATLVDVEIIDQPTLMAMAVKVGKTRLIDNTILKPDPTEN